MPLGLKIFGTLTTTAALADLDFNFNLLAARILTQTKVLSFTRDVAVPTGPQSITGVGFTPTALTFFAAISNGPAWSNGFDDGTIGSCIAGDVPDAGADAVIVDGTNSILLAPSAGNNYRGKIVSMDADGFTVLWTQTGAPVGMANIFFLAQR